jgi:beta-glucosidase
MCYGSEWKFKGTITSDWGGTNNTAKSVTPGTDLEMPGPAVRRGAHLLAAIKEDNIQVSDVESCLRRILKTPSRANLLGPYPELVVEKVEKAAKVSTSSGLLKLVQARRSSDE